MDIKKTLPISEARKKIFEIAAEVQKPGTHYTLTENGRPAAVVISAEEYESWQETLEVMKDVPDLKQKIREAEDDYTGGRYAFLEDILAKQGYVLADKSRKQYGIPCHHPKKRSKNARQSRS